MDSLRKRNASMRNSYQKYKTILTVECNGSDSGAANTLLGEVIISFPLSFYKNARFYPFVEILKTLLSSYNPISCKNLWR